jgi:hypothetical protein
MTLRNNPVVRVTFQSPDRMFCTLFLLDKIPGSKFKRINDTFNNESTNTFSFTIDPTKPPLNLATLSDLSGCYLGWAVKCFDLDTNARVTFSFEVTVTDGGVQIMSSTINETDPSVTISSSGNTAIFDGNLLFP